MQSESSTTLNSLKKRFELCLLDYMFGHGAHYAPYYCKLVLKFYKCTCQKRVGPPWLQLKCNLRIAQLKIPSIKGLDCVCVIICFGHDVHCVHRAAKLRKVLQTYLPEGVGPPWLQLKCNLRIPQL